ncbi:hypothetical protein L596_021993 [Steinernema carpocapsae]|uniref:MPN domain-containing protein n=1 Tax=Steinernema carpocapsae TaxID=34508 RepID=A0A4U5MKS1_STECR|nr:hypothetical protein L596_021993 [Steinernema carpocapsae]
MASLPRLLGEPAKDDDREDTSEIIYISSLALLKMLKHSRAGVPFEVMGLMLGDFVDEYTVEVYDVFAMPQTGTGVSVEAVDPVFQADMMAKLAQTEREDTVVGWYHSHPGFGCWLSSTDIDTQRSFERLDEQSVAVVVDPIQSVKGKVVIDAFRTIPRDLLLTVGARQTTSNLYYKKGSSLAKSHGLDFDYFSILIDYRKSELDHQMLEKIKEPAASELLKLESFAKRSKDNQELMASTLKFAKLYKKGLDAEREMTAEEFEIRNVGKQDPKRHLEETARKMMDDNIVHSLTTIANLKAFHSGTLEGDLAQDFAEVSLCD